MAQVVSVLIMAQVVSVLIMAQVVSVLMAQVVSVLIMAHVVSVLIMAQVVSSNLIGPFQWRRFGDMRLMMGKHVLSMWHKLSDKKGNFIPNLIGPFLEITLVRQKGMSLPLPCVLCFKG